MSTRRLYFASTPMIALSCAGAAIAAGDRARLVLIEDFDLAEQFAQLLTHWRDTPFESIERLPGRHTEHLRGATDHKRGIAALAHRVRVKRDLRRQTLAQLGRLDAEYQPHSIWLANDRKVETQYALQLAARRRPDQQPGRYLDDGLYTYLGDVRQRPLVRRIDWLVKRMTYGRWWQRVAQAGTTSWISQCWLAFPEHAPPPYLDKQIHALPREWFANRAFLRLARDAARGFAVPRRQLRDGCSGVLVLPHSNQLRANPDLAGQLRALLQRANQQGSRLALKYHPREVEADPGRLLDGTDALVLPALLPMELLLPWLGRGALLAGEGSTALLAARWLRPDLDVRDLGISRDGYAARARRLFIDCAIRPLHD